MLKSLTLRNLATISDTRVDFGKGLNILTGETGAGKSILIDGLLLALGERADRGMVRPGAQAASVEAVFDSSEHERIVRREVRTQGRSRFFIDDQLSTLEEGRDLIAGLVDLHSQDSTPALLARRVQMKSLDEFGGCLDIAVNLSALFRHYSSSLERLQQLRSGMEDIRENRDIAEHELSLIQRLNPSQDDYRSLMDERRQLKAAGDGAGVLERLNRTISGDDGMLDVISSLTGALRSTGMDVADIMDLLEQAEIALSEADQRCESILSDMDNAPWRLEEIDNRLDAYSELLGRCGGSLETLLERRNELDRELSGYDDLKSEMEELEKSVPAMEMELAGLAGKLSDSRKKAAELLVASVQEELRLLGMPHALFRVQMCVPDTGRSMDIQGRRICADGAEIPEFRFTANPGMEPAPLSAVASGGEMSRISLVLKLALSSVTQAPTMVFDEIDSGVGGETANLLADSLQRVSLGRQVIVITHLPQIASRARHHIAVSKETLNGLPETRVRILSQRADRVEELSRLLGGGSGAREHAEQLVPQDLGEQA